MKRVFRKMAEVITKTLQQLCDSMSPKTRLIVVGAMTVIFTTLALYIFVDSVFSNETQQIKINTQLENGTETK